MNVNEYDKLRPTVAVKIDDQKIRFNALNQQLLWRIETLFSKEPSTIEWLNRLNTQSILIDVGANVGMYSIYAAGLKGSRVFAFEPESQNYSTLIKNVIANNVETLITAFPACLSDEIKLDTLHLSQFTWNGGGSCHSFGEEVGFDLQPRKSPLAQGSVSYTLDKAIQDGTIPLPTHMKIDVDGFEHKVLRGAHHTLRNKKLHSLCIEINPNLSDHLEALEELNALGFYYSQDQVDKVARKDGAFKGCAEYIFDRLSEPKFKIFTNGFHSLADDSQELQDVKNYVLDKVANAQIITDPYPYIVIDNIMPEKYYAEVLKYFPSIDSAVALGETGRVTKGSYQERKVTLFNEDHFAKMTSSQQQFWNGFATWLYSSDFITSLIEKFAPWCSNRLVALQDKNSDLKISCDALLVHDKEKYSIGPHTDGKHRLLTFLFYTPDDLSNSDLGTSIYAPNNPDFQCPGGPHYGFDEFHEVERIDFVPNRLLCFVRTNKSFHGVEPIAKENVDRKLIINNIRLFDE